VKSHLHLAVPRFFAGDLENKKTTSQMLEKHIESGLSVILCYKGFIPLISQKAGSHF